MSLFVLLLNHVPRKTSGFPRIPVKWHTALFRSFATCAYFQWIFSVNIFSHHQRTQKPAEKPAHLVNSELNNWILIMLIFLHAINSHQARETNQLLLSYFRWTVRGKSLFYCISEKKNSSFLRISSYGQRVKETRVVYHLPQNSGNFDQNVNNETISPRKTGKFPK